jgi:glucosamine-6-phosphate deaminase
MRADALDKILSVAPEKLIGTDGISVEVAGDDAALSRRFAGEMAGLIERNNGEGRATSLILPVGPRGGYPLFVDLVCEKSIDLSRTTFFFMDEYLDDDGGLIPEDHPLSFRGFVKRALVGPLTGRYDFDPGRVRFPDPGMPGQYDEEIAAAGGIDAALCGVGINGHVAFNEPRPDMSAEEFARLGTRVVELSRETRAVNALMEAGGAVDFVPKRAVTVGMARILEARRVVVFMNRPWQRAAVRLFLFGEVSAEFPVSLICRHGSSVLCITKEVSERPIADRR